METNELRFSEKDRLSDDEFAPKNVKVRITTFIDKDVLDMLKKEAAISGKKYQTLLNEKLREAVFEEQSIKYSLEKLDQRLSVVEKKIQFG